jgi:hypothetical protein
MMIEDGVVLPGDVIGGNVDFGGLGRDLTKLAHQYYI